MAASACGMSPSRAIANGYRLDAMMPALLIDSRPAAAVIAMAMTPGRPQNASAAVATGVSSSAGDDRPRDRGRSR